MTKDNKAHQSASKHGQKVVSKGNNHHENSSQSGYSNGKKKDIFVSRSKNAVRPNCEGEELRSVYAAYLNIARMNLYNTLRYIGRTCGIDDNVQEGSMQEMQVVNFANYKFAEKRQNIRRALMRHLPVLQSMTQAFVNTNHLVVEDCDIQILLQNIIRVITDSRNYLTHANPYNSEESWEEQKKIERDLLAPIDKAFMSAKRKVKRVFNYTINDMKFIDGQERMVDTGETIEVIEKGQRRTKKLYREDPNYFFRLRTPEGDGLSSVGLAFLTCKLLHKKQATIFAQRTGIFRSSSQRGYSPFTKKENEVMFNIFCAERIRLPQGRMESTADTMALGLDMLAELQKCPAELFETFCPADRKLYEVAKGDVQPGTSDNDINLMRRNGDRFARLAMQYIDSFNADPDHKNKRNIAPLPDMAFQISLGKFRHTFYERPPFHCNTEKDLRLRVLQKEINGFGPLTKIEELRREQYDTIIRHVNNDDSDRLYDADTATSCPYITDHHASYAITGNRIGLMWNVDQNNSTLNSDTLCYLPPIPSPSATDNPTKPLVVDTKAIRHNAAPLAWLSIYDLPALIFLHLLDGKPSKVIKETYNKLNNLFDDIAEGRRDPYFKGQLPQKKNDREKKIKELRKELDISLLKDYGLHTRDIPDKVAEFLIGAGLAGNERIAIWQAEERFLKWCDDKVKTLKESLDRRIIHFDKDIQMIGDRMNRIGRKGYVDIRPGSLARYLAKDMLAMVNPKFGPKPSGLEFALLQTSIATFHGDGQPFAKTELGSIIEKIKTFQGHPFLSGIMSQVVNDTIDFYMHYQKAKSIYLNNLLESRKYVDAYFLREAHRNQMAKTRTYMRDSQDAQGNIIEGLAHRYRHTLQLPDGLFTDAIREKLAIIDNHDIQAALSDEKRGHSAAYLLNVWFTKVMGDDSQPFYRNQGELYKRHYKVMDSLYPSADGKETYFNDDEISRILRKGEKAKAPIAIKMDTYIEKLEMTIGKKFDPQKNKKVAIYGPADQATKDTERIKLMHQLRDMQRNERDIRRHRNEDMLLFLMAKRLLLSGGPIFAGRAESDSINQFRLRNVVPIGANHDEENNLLNQKVTFSTRVSLLDDHNKPIKDSEKRPVQRTIHQDEIKLKNYGDFFRFLYDTRIGLLLSQQPDSAIGINREDLEKELDTYDAVRSEVFKSLHKIERQIIKEHPELNNPQSEHFNNAKGVPYRNSFASLLSLAARFNDADGNPSLQAKYLTALRNAFSHNKYVEDIKVMLGKGEVNLPQVAKALSEWVDSFGNGRSS